MDSMIYNPLKEYGSKFKQLHLDNTTAFFEDLVRRSGVNIEENRETVRKYQDCKENLEKLKKKLRWLKFLRVIMCISVVLIPVVIWKTTPKIRGLKEDIE